MSSRSFSDITQAQWIKACRTLGLTKRAREYLLLVLIFLLPWQTRLIFRVGELNGGVWEYGTLSAFATEALLWFIVVLRLSHLRFKISDLRFNILRIHWKLEVGNWKFLAVLLFPAFAAVSALWSPVPQVTLQHARFLFDGVLLYWLIRSSHLPLSRIAYAFVLGVTVQSALGIWQFFSQFAHSSTLFGMAVHDPALPGASVVEGSFGRWLRAYGGLPHPNVLGGYAAVALLFVIARLKAVAIPSGLSPYGRSAAGMTSSFHALAMTLMIALLTSALILTFSRSAWIAAAVGLGLLILFARERRSLIITISTIAAVAAIMSILLAPIMSARLTGVGRLEAGSFKERASYFDDARALIARHPWFGAGAGAFTAAVAREVDPARPAYLLQPVHHAWLLVLAELGVTGFVLFVYIVWRQRQWSGAGIAIFGTLLALTLFDHYLYSLISGVYLLWMSFGFLGKSGLDKSNQSATLRVQSDDGTFPKWRTNPLVARKRRHARDGS